MLNKKIPQKRKNPANKKILIAANLIGFVHFLWEDIDMFQEKGYEVSYIADNRLNENYTLAELERRNVTFLNVNIDSKSPINKKNFEVYKTYRKVLHEGNYAYVHCHTPIVAAIMRLAAFPLRLTGGGKSNLYFSWHTVHQSLAF